MRSESREHGWAVRVGRGVPAEPRLTEAGACHRPSFLARSPALLLPLVGLVFLTACGERTASPAAKAKTAAAAPETSWPMTRGDPALSGSIAAPLPRNLVTAWTFTANGAVQAEAAIAGGRIFVGTTKGTLHALATDTGKELWRFETKDAIMAAPAVAAGKVFLSSNDGKLYALDAATGAPAWNFSTDDKVSSGAITIKSPTGSGDWVLVNGYDGTTRALAAADGKLVWSYKAEEPINGSPAIVDGRFLVFGGCDSQLHVVNLADGTLVRKIATSAQIPASIATHGTMAFCGNYANEAVAFDVTGGKVAWTYQDRQLPFMSAPAVNDRLVLLGSRDKQLHAINRADGQAAWTFKTGGRVEGSPILFSDGVVFGSTDGRLYAANLEKGEELWQLDLGEALVASPAYGARLLVIGGDKGTVFALRAGPAAK
ncbi:MAG: PQQ-binding-like beta-propeller repeat protein [Opitutaceae bacterium]|nr:PQQ-binding-like beta-propeller repeat protein [Opitutaceae bacterium]